MSAVQLEFAALTDVGREREHNEDNYLVDDTLSLFIVCDGMGGHAAGEVASAIAVRTVHEEVRRELDLINDYVAGKTGLERVSKRDILNMLEFAVNRASAKVHQAAEKDPRKRGMGTTLVAILFAGAQAFIVWVGDSRIYLLRDGGFEQVTEDHTVYNELIKRKKMSREQVEKLAPKNAITRAVGVYEHAEPDTLVLDVLAGDRFLLCSDGLCGYYEEEDGLAKLGQMVQEPDENRCVRTLIDAANEQGGKDNITALVVTTGSRSSRDEVRAKKLRLKRDLLARMPLFRPLNEKELRRVLAVTDVLACVDGDRVVTEGEKGDELFIVFTGTVKVLKGDSQIASLKPGEHFGEMALIRAQPRSATVISDGTSELIVLRRSDFFEILRAEHQLAVKLLWQFLGVLADRLVLTSKELGSAKEELAAEVTFDEFLDDDDDGDRKSIQLPPPPPSLRQEHSLAPPPAPSQAPKPPSAPPGPSNKPGSVAPPPPSSTGPAPTLPTPPKISVGKPGSTQVSAPPRPPSSRKPSAPPPPAPPPKPADDDS